MKESINLNRYKVFLFVVVLFILLVVGGWVFLNYRLEHILTKAQPKQPYGIEVRKTDTLKIVAIGDSWAGLHQSSFGDSVFQDMLVGKLHRPVSFHSKGKGGEISRGIYNLMFEDEGYGTKELLSSGADYCIVFAGINDAAANLGTKQFLHHYRLILDFLVAEGIKPIVVEIPDVNIWNVYKDKPIKDFVVDFVKSRKTNCNMYEVKEYRKQLRSDLAKNDWLGKVLYIQVQSWNTSGLSVNEQLFMPDQVHLNSLGYKRLDSCIAAAIYSDLEQGTNSASFYEPME